MTEITRDYTTENNGGDNYFTVLVRCENKEVFGRIRDFVESIADEIADMGSEEVPAKKGLSEAEIRSEE